MNIFEETMKHFEKAYEKAYCRKPVIDEEDLYLSWEEFHKIHPKVDKWEYEQKQKELQEE